MKFTEFKGIKIPLLFKSFWQILTNSVDADMQKTLQILDDINNYEFQWNLLNSKVMKILVVFLKFHWFFMILLMKKLKIRYKN